MAYTKTTWVNNSSPYINATNLNHIETGIKDNETAIDTLSTNTTNSINNIKGTILWTNSIPTSNFSSQQITLSSNDYDCYEIIYRQNTTTSRAFSTGKTLKGYGTILMQAIGQNQYRTIDYVSDTALQINSNQKVITYGTNAEDDNSINIPMYVVGYKTGLF